MNLYKINMAFQNNINPTNSKRKLESDDDDDGHTVKQQNTDSKLFPKFLVLTSLNEDKPLTKTSPFLLHKSIQSCAGEIKKVSKMKNGSLLVECLRQQQSKNLLSLTKIGDLKISVTPHKSLNSCQGVIRDRDRDLSDLSEEQICDELNSQHVSKVKRFSKKSDNKIIQLNTYLLTFELSHVPEHIYLGPYRIKVNAYVPNPTRCFKCQKFGHGKSSCHGTERCVKCSLEGHSSFGSKSDKV